MAIDLNEYYVTPTRIEISRFVPFAPDEVFAVLRDPAGHVEIDSTGMLQGFTGEPAGAIDDRFVIHMDRESLGDFDLGRYDVTVIITAYEENRSIEWTIDGAIKPPIGHVYGYRLEAATGTGHRDGESGTEVVAIYDWSNIHDEWKQAEIFPVISPMSVRATLGILERVVRHRNR